MLLIITNFFKNIRGILRLVSQIDCFELGLAASLTLFFHFTS